MLHIVLGIGQEDQFYRARHELKDLLDLFQVHGWSGGLLAVVMGMVVAEEHAVRAYFCVGACLADQLQRSLMLRACLGLSPALLLPLVGWKFAQIFDHIDDADILGEVFLDASADDYFCSALGAGEDFAIGLDGESAGDAFLAVGVSAPRDYSRRAVVDVEIKAAQRACWSERLWWELWHSNSSLYYQSSSYNCIPKQS